MAKQWKMKQDVPAEDEQQDTSSDEASDEEQDANGDQAETQEEEAIATWKVTK